MLPDQTPVLALIPSRGGSRGIPRKNLAAVHGKPLMGYTIEAALGSSRVDEVWVSSEDDEILQVAQSLGARPLSRPAGLAGDEASAVGVVHHFIGQLSEDMRRRDPLIAYLQPTSPLRTSAHVDAALRTLVDGQARALLSVSGMEKSPFKAFRLDEQGRLLSLFDEKLSNANRQDLPPTYMPNGAIYLFGVSEFLERDGFPSNGALPFVMDGTDSIDVDTPDDLERVAMILGERHG